MKKLAVVGALLAMVAIPGDLMAGEVDLATYLRLLRVAPGGTMEAKIEQLTALGVTLSAQGLRELTQLATGQQSPKPPQLAQPAQRRSQQPANPFAGLGGERGEANPFAGLGEVPLATPPSHFEVPSTSTYVWPSPPRITVPAVPTHRGYGLSGTSTRLGDSTFYNYSDGTTGTSTRLGDTAFYNFSDGTSGTANRLGTTTFYNNNRGMSGTTNQIGGFEFHNFNNGLSGTSTQIGGFTFHTFSNGQNCTSNRIGSFVYTNCY